MPETVVAAICPAENVEGLTCLWDPNFPNESCDIELTRNFYFVTLGDQRLVVAPCGTICLHQCALDSNCNLTARQTGTDALFVRRPRLKRRASASGPPGAAGAP